MQYESSAAFDADALDDFDLRGQLVSRAIKLLDDRAVFGAHAAFLAALDEHGATCTSKQAALAAVHIQAVRNARSGFPIWRDQHARVTRLTRADPSLLAPLGRLREVS